ncbi:NUDIX hydrolase [Candidatus Nanosalina sp. VS9-1]|uniref:NUDIX hydrolase n=1 Tax=Candidatus Nanosalina sp. VS9-1 TaxID=3388566 RepID=UPI0039E0B56E
MNFLPEDSDIDYTASALIIQDGEILFIDHEKLGKWLQPGGHIDENETPDQAARREVREETGLEIDFIEGSQPESFSIEEDLPRPFHVNIHRIRDGHLHCDFMYLATVVAEGEATHGHEHSGLKWFSRSELKDEELRMPDNVRRTALKALDENR